MKKIEKRGKVSILDNERVIKCETDFTNLHNYLMSRDFSYFPKVMNRENGQNEYEFLPNYTLNKDQLGSDIAVTLALLHNKTSYSKEVTHDQFQNIYESLIGYTHYLNEYYFKLLRKIEYVDFPSPSELLFTTNYTKIKEVINFIEKELENWYALVKNKTKTRLCLNHGNMNLSHALISDKVYFISWEKNTFDSPVIDLIHFYHNEWQNIEFSSVLESYWNKCTWTEEEKKLFFINISIPIQITIDNNDEWQNVVETRRLFDYIYKTEKLIRPYYTIQNEEQ